MLKKQHTCGSDCSETGERHDCCPEQCVAGLFLCDTFVSLCRFLSCGVLLWKATITSIVITTTVELTPTSSTPMYNHKHASDSFVSYVTPKALPAWHLDNSPGLLSQGCYRYLINMT